MQGDLTPPNIPDYGNNLAFKPAMTWEELCEWARKRNMYVLKFTIFHKGMYFGDDGKIGLENSNIIFAENRTYEQMKNIIDNLYGE